jgi:glycosyltransferase 2 family protein
MRSNVIKLTSLAVSIGIVVALILYANPQKFFLLVSQSNYTLLGFALIVSTINLFVRVLKWQVLLDKISFRTLIPIQLLGTAISNFSPGKIAEPVKCILLKLKTGLAVSNTLPSIILERLVDITVLLLLSLIGIIFFLPLSGSLALLSLLSFTLFVIVIAVVCLFFYNESFRRKLFNFFRKLPLINKLPENFIDNFSKNSVKSRRLLLSFCITILAWILEGVVIYLSLMALGVSLNPLVLATIFALATLIGVATTLPGGIGSTDAVMIIFLGSFGVEHTIAITGVLISRFLSLWYSNLVGGVSMIYLAKKTKLSYKAVFR